jgi:hypothetical protein
MLSVGCRATSGPRGPNATDVMAPRTRFVSETRRRPIALTLATPRMSPAMTRLPSLLSANAEIGVCLASSASSGAVPELQSLAVPSSLAVTSEPPSGLNSTMLIAPL